MRGEQHGANAGLAAENNAMNKLCPEKPTPQCFSPSGGPPFVGCRGATMDGGGCCILGRDGGPTGWTALSLGGGPLGPWAKEKIQLPTHPPARPGDRRGKCSLGCCGTEGAEQGREADGPGVCGTVGPSVQSHMQVGWPSCHPQPQRLGSPALPGVGRPQEACLDEGPAGARDGWEWAQLTLGSATPVSREG